MIAVSDDDDWFERALREDDDAGDDEAAETTDEAAETTDEAAETTDEAAVGEDADGSVESGGDDGTENRDDDDPDTESGAGDGDATGREETDGPPSEPEPTDSDVDNDDTGESPFGQDFASALENAPDPGGQSQPGGTGGEGGGTNPFGGGSPFGGGQEGDDEFGFDDVGGTDPESFDEAEFDSDLERLDIGIDGLDQMILGGVPRRSLMVAIGSAGTGKTTFGLQFLNHGLEQGENAVYITLEESFDRIVSTADEKGWGFGEYVDEGRLSIVDIDPIEMANSLDSIQNDLPNLIEDFGADRLVLDSVSLLEMMYESAPRRRSQVFGFARALKQAGITTLLTSEADRNHAYASRFGIVEYLADAVFVLQYVRPSDFRETRLAIEIQKIRDANHSRETKPYDLTDEGISVYRQANIF